MSVNILLIDDHSAVERIFGFLLRETAYKDASLIQRLTLEAGLEAMARVTPSVIFLDNRLPPYTDFREPLSQIQELNTGCPVVLMTGSDLSDLGYDAVPEGFSGFLSKTMLTAEAIATMLDEII
jgi:DNA-binding NtrC family response regulator